MNLRDGMLLYHGSYAAIDKIDLEQCEAGKDFGKGFYLTADKEQAKKFIKTSLLKAKAKNKISENQNYGYVTCYRYKDINGMLKCFEFIDANQEWLWFVSLNSRKRLAQQLMPMIKKEVFGSDIIIGKIANDTTNPVITAYLNGLYGSIDEEASAQIAISLLLPDRLKNQYCFLTYDAIKCLEIVEVCKYEL